MASTPRVRPQPTEVEATCEFIDMSRHRGVIVFAGYGPTGANTLKESEPRVNAPVSVLLKVCRPKVYINPMLSFYESHLRSKGIRSPKVRSEPEGEAH